MRLLPLYSIILGASFMIFLILAHYLLSKLNYENNMISTKIEDSEKLIYNSTNNIEKIIHKTNSKIKQELSSYNFTYSGVYGLDDLLIEQGGQPMRSLIVSTWRSGSTYFGQLLEAIPGTFYHYQPLLKYGHIQIRRPPISHQAVADIKNMFKCNFYGMDDYFEYGRTDLSQFYNSKRLWEHCNINKDLCFDADFTSRFCKLFPFQTMKLCRLRLQLVQDILNDMELNVKIILLVRDPRGVMNSRQYRYFCQAALDCWQPELLCADMMRDYKAAARLLSLYPGKLMVVRFEELALNPVSTTRRILEFLKISSSKSIDDFLQSHTNVKVEGIASTYRVSRDVPFKWKKVMEFSEVNEIQMVCQGAMTMWGYRLAHNATDMTSKEFNPIQNYTIHL